MIFCSEKPTENPWNLRPISDGEKATGVGLGSFTRLIRGVKIDCWGSCPVSMWMKLWNPPKWWWSKVDVIFLVIWSLPFFFSHIATECVFSANLLVLHLHNTRPGHAERHKAQSHWRCQSDFWDRKMLNHFKSSWNEMYDKALQPIGCFGGCWMDSLISLGQRNPSPSFP